MKKRKINFLSELRVMRKSYMDNIIIGHFNINSLRNKFSSVKKLCQSLDLTITNEAKLDGSFPKAQFQINGYKCVRKERTSLVDVSIFP